MFALARGRKRRKCRMKVCLCTTLCSLWGCIWIMSTLEINDSRPRSPIALFRGLSVTQVYGTNIQLNSGDLFYDGDEKDKEDQTEYLLPSSKEQDNDDEQVVHLETYINNDSLEYNRKALEEYLLRKVNNIECDKVMKGDGASMKSARHIMKFVQRNAVPIQTYSWILDCSSFKRNRGYIQHIFSGSERQFPLAFALVVYRDVEQVERLLRAIYRPHNYYCLHIDVKTKQSDHDALISISSCFNNVFVVDNPVNVTWGEFSVLEAEILCMKLLWRFKEWKYYINLTGQEFPLKTNLEIVEILKAMKGANIVDGTSLRAGNKAFFRWTQAGNRPPHNIKPVKGSVHVAVNRDFVEFCIHDKRSHDFQEWLKKTEIPDETFFASLNHNPRLGIAGSFLGGSAEYPSKPLFIRYKLWQDRSERERAICMGKYVRGICVIGVGDLPQLVHHPGLFVNKLYLEYEYIALDCLEQMLLERTIRQYINRTKIDVSFYESVDQVKYQLKRK